jgi:hypothetical protein
LKNTRVRIFSFADDQGFTLVEAVVSLGVVAIIFLAATEGTIWMAKSNKSIANSTSNASGNALGSGAFGTTFGSANIAVQFEHMPIPNGGTAATGCSWTTANPASFVGAGPCVATMSGGVLAAGQVAGLVQNKGSTTPLSWIEFFRDDNAILNGVGSTTGQPYTATGTSAPTGQYASVQRSTPIDAQVLNTLASAASSGTTYYATWPLVPSAGTSTQPLMVLQSASASPLLFVQSTALGSSIPPGGGRYALMQASSFTTTPAQILGSIFVVYNVSDPTQYVFQYAADVQSCQFRPIVGKTNPTNAALCAAIAQGSFSANGFPQASPTPAPTPVPLSYYTAWFQGESASSPEFPGDTVPYFAVDLEPLSLTTPVGSNTLSSYFSPSSYFGSASNLLWMDGYGGTTVPSFYPFPSEFSTLADTTDPKSVGDFLEYSQTSGAVNPGSGVDIRRIEHYYDLLGRKINLMAVPVSMESIALSAPISTRCTASGKTSACQAWNVQSTIVSQVGTGSPAPIVKNLMSNLPLVGASNNASAAPAGAVVVARPIGSSNFQLLYFSPSGVTVSN